MPHYLEKVFYHMEAFTLSLITRGSAALDKAQRRLALLKSIEEQLDLGYGLNVESYSQLINATRSTLEAHNTLVSNLEESRKTVTQMEKALSELSRRMLTGVAAKYGRDSMHYIKAGGSNGTRKTSSASQTPATSAASPTQPSQTTTSATTNAYSNGSTNGYVNTEV